MEAETESRITFSPLIRLRSNYLCVWLTYSSIGWKYQGKRKRFLLKHLDPPRGITPFHTVLLAFSLIVWRLYFQLVLMWPKDEP
jgi:hypothetical protein